MRRAIRLGLYTADDLTPSQLASEFWHGRQSFYEHTEQSLSLIDWCVVQTTSKQPVVIICKKIKCGNAERRRRKNRGATGAEGVGCGEGVSPSPPEEGSGDFPEKLWNFHPKMVSFGAIWSAICNVSQPAFTRKLKLQEHSTLPQYHLRLFVSHTVFGP